MINFSLDDLRKIADSSAFSRGYDYYVSGQSSIIKQEKLSNDMIHIEAKTEGSKTYTQKINIYDRAEGIKILGQCSCPVGKQCKHVVSVLLTLLDEIDPALESEPEGELDQWLESLAQAGDEIAQIFTTSTQLLYELKEAKNGNDITMTLFTARQLKNGGYGKVNKARPNALFNSYTPPEYFRESDIHAVRLFKALANSMSVSVILRGELGAMVLEAALKTKRCFWQKGHTTPLEKGEMRPLKSSWERTGERHQLQFNMGEKSFCINTIPPFYVDSRLKKVGPLETSLSMQQIALIQEAPFIKSEELQEVTVTLSQQLPALEMELPDTLVSRVISGTYPQPKLYLTATRKQHFVRLLFSYKGYELNGLNGQSMIESDEGMIKIIREAAYEKEILDYIKSLGFEEEKAVLIPAYELGDSGRIDAWRLLIEKREALESQGIDVIIEEAFEYRFDSVDHVDVEVDAKSHWFDVSMQVSIEGTKVPLLPLISSLLKDRVTLNKLPKLLNLAVDENRFIRIESRLIKPVLKTLYELLEVGDGESVKVHNYELAAMDHFHSKDFSVHSSPEMMKLSQKLKSFKKIERLESPKGLQATLREYQIEGLSWLGFLQEYGFGGILADDMGLGKTVQTLGHLQAQKEQGRMTKPTLVVAPTSLLGNWRREAARFTPDLKVAVSHGKDRQEILKNMDQYDLIITTYTLLTLDSERLQKEKFFYLILDEAQKIKNSRSQATLSAKKMEAEHFLALSGTPMENHLGELWSIFDLVMPGLLGGQKLFKELYQNPIEKEHDRDRQAMLNRRIAPFMLRRTKEKVATELPAKTEMIRTVAFEDKQAALYETIRVTMEEKVQQSIKDMGLGRSHITILDALLKLRQVCCDPRLLSIESAQSVHESAKLEMLMELVEELLEEKRRILIFSQFTTMLGLIEEAFTKANVSYTKLTGSTRDREGAIDRFKVGAADVFLISLKAGGIGLNLTEADTVIHYDPWWNPAVQDQATDRAYRIGQDKPVFVYKLIIEKSVEEKIVAMQKGKKALADALYEGKEEGFKKLDAQSLQALFEKL